MPGVNIFEDFIRDTEGVSDEEMGWGYGAEDAPAETSGDDIDAELSQLEAEIDAGASGSSFGAEGQYIVDTQAIATEILNPEAGLLQWYPDTASARSEARHLAEIIQRDIEAHPTAWADMPDDQKRALVSAAIRDAVFAFEDNVTAPQQAWAGLWSAWSRKDDSITSALTEGAKAIANAEWTWMTQDLPNLVKIAAGLKEGEHVNSLASGLWFLDVLQGARDQIVGFDIPIVDIQPYLPSGFTLPEISYVPQIVASVDRHIQASGGPGEEVSFPTTMEERAPGEAGEGVRPQTVLALGYLASIIAGTTKVFG